MIQLACNPRHNRTIHVAIKAAVGGLLLVVAWLGIPRALKADPATAAMKRGVDAERMYQFGDLDAINLFNGNLSLRLPLGQEYPVSSSVSYGVALTYNSSSWDYLDRPIEEPPGGLPPGPTVDAVPDLLSNAGMGWRLSLGNLLGPGATGNNSNNWVYVAPDGGDHVLFSGFTSPCDSQECRTRDLSFVRMTWSGPNPVLTFPDGTRHVFEAEPGTSRWRLSKIMGTFSDPDRPDLSVTYWCSNLTPPCAPSEAIWTLEDRHHRIQQISFSADPSGRYPALIHQVVLSSFGDIPSTYTFHYVTRTFSTPCTRLDLFSASTPVSMLSSIDLPDGTTYFMAYELADCAAYGALTSLRIPTGGYLTWQYGFRDMPVRACGAAPWTIRVPAVHLRTLKDANGAALGSWSYTSSLSNPIPEITQELELECEDGLAGGPSEELKVEVRTPVNDKIVHYFSAYPGVPTITGAGPTSFMAGEQGLPFTRFTQEDSVVGVPRFLSTEVFDCDEVTGACPADPVRRTYVRYERDSECQTADTSCLNDNQRLASALTVYLDEPDCLWPPAQSPQIGEENCLAKWSDSSDYDGYGHYRQMTTGANFGPGGSKTSFTRYDPNPSTWILGTYDLQTIAEGSSKVASTYAFDVGTGFLRCIRNRANAAKDGATDTVVVYEPDALGFPATERRYGGDQPGYGAPTGCDTSSATPRYVLTHGYSSGVRSSTTVQTSGGPLSLLDLTIDNAAGLPSASRDAAGLQTSLTYDWKGLLTSEMPPGAATTFYEFCPPGVPGNCAGSTTFARLLTTTGSGSPPLEQERTTFDGLGRVKKIERATPPAGSWVGRNITYDGAGWKTFESEWGSSAGTSYTQYDPFGRPGKITKADGAAITFLYSGDSQARSVSRFWNGQADEEAKGAQFFDREGRLFVVKEPNGTRTRYHYDVAGRLVAVEQNVGNANQQIRTFRYDGRGFLMSEKHPESGETTYTYDALGNKLTSSTGGSKLRYVYDGAGRLTDVYSPRGALLKQFAYGPSTPSTGKLTDEWAYNYRIAGSPAVCTNFEVKEHYDYGSTHGWATDKTTSLKQGTTSLQRFKQSYQYDGAGRITTLTYPNCDSGCTSTGRPVTTNYRYGRPISISDFASSITYNPNQTVYSILHTNNVTDLQAQDPWGLPRPASISAKLGGSFVWAQQDYAYDPSGNIKSIGGTSYAYDNLSRLTSAHITGLTPKDYQEYTYDVFGNLTSMCTSTFDAGCNPFVGVNYPTSTTSNRLSSGSYNGRGDLTGYLGSSYTWDRFDNLATVNTGSETWTHTYDANNERIWSWRTSGSRVDTYALRGLGGSLLRDYKNDSSGLSWEDYIYREGQLLASVSASSTDPLGTTRHFHLDHLGTVRRVTSHPGGGLLASHDLWPYGEEYTPQTDGEEMRFAGHERDLGIVSASNASADDIDYMHARHYRPLFGRFLSVDKAHRRASQPQTLNRYSFARGNPVLRLDRDGRTDGAFFEEFAKDRDYQAQLSAARAAHPSADADFQARLFLAPLIAVTLPAFVVLAPEGGAGAMLVSQASNALAGAITTPDDPVAGAVFGGMVGTAGGVARGGPLSTPFKNVVTAAAASYVMDGAVDKSTLLPAAGTGVAVGWLELAANVAGGTPGGAILRNFAIAMDAAMQVTIAAGATAGQPEINPTSKVCPPPPVGCTGKQ